MKYKITDSQLESVIFLYLDNQDFIQIERENSIYFVNSEDDEYAQIRYDKDDGWCYIHYKLVDEISSFFSLGESDSEQVIGRWVENTLQMRVTHTSSLSDVTAVMVENTIQMRVTHTHHQGIRIVPSLGIPSN
jgi:hypothetical protein